MRVELVGLHRVSEHQNFLVRMMSFLQVWDALGPLTFRCLERVHTMYLLLKLGIVEPLCSGIMCLYQVRTCESIHTLHAADAMLV